MFAGGWRWRRDRWWPVAVSNASGGRKLGGGCSADLRWVWKARAIWASTVVSLKKRKEQFGAEHMTTPVNPNVPKPSKVKAKSLPSDIIHGAIDTAAGLLHDAVNIGQKIFRIFRKANETSYDLVLGNRQFGALTDAVVNVLNQRMGGGLSNRQLMVEAAKILKDKGLFDQNPCLYCSDKNTNATFLGDLA
ncbi:hypothetical protein J1N35_033351 [Gossypium stocksii]|uniref:Uncharacterized protein n=1 Tax=Gossypium stocksii TaxID=47602 RepID=A0A9D3UQ82_9ROSI|nr:hypothetical protein J1N35_033351 [Gossypium stocksii]